MRSKKEKNKILKVRPFNMANFSGGSGYLVFSVLYQTAAILPGMVFIWLASLIKLSKNEAGETDEGKACKRFYFVSVPVSVVLILIAAVLAFSFNYGTFQEYWFEIILIVLAPSVSAFFILKKCHKEIINGRSTWKMILASFVGVISVLTATLFLCWLVIDPILTSLAA